MYVVITLRNVTRNFATYMHSTQGHRYRPYVRHTVGHIQICSAQIGVVDCGRQCSLEMEMEVLC